MYMYSPMEMSVIILMHNLALRYLLSLIVQLHMKTRDSGRLMKALKYIVQNPRRSFECVVKTKCKKSSHCKVYSV